MNARKGQRLSLANFNDEAAKYRNRLEYFTLQAHFVTLKTLIVKIYFSSYTSQKKLGAALSLNVVIEQVKNDPGRILFSTMFLQA